MPPCPPTTSQLRDCMKLDVWYPVKALGVPQEGLATTSSALLEILVYFCPEVQLCATIGILPVHQVQVCNTETARPDALESEPCQNTRYDSAPHEEPCQICRYSSVLQSKPCQNTRYSSASHEEPCQRRYRRKHTPDDNQRSRHSF